MVDHGIRCLSEIDDLKELVVDQAVEIKKLRAKVAEHEEAVKAVHCEIYCMGAPLNDNIDHYSNPQLVRFFRIAEHLGLT